MAAKKKITKELIVKTGVKLLKKQGMDYINARNLAKELKCSTQPIYLSFQGMEELKSAVGQEALKIFKTYASNKAKQYPEDAYKAYGMAYITFAKEESQLFQYLFMRNRTGEQQDDGEKEFEEEYYPLMKENICKNVEEAYELHVHMWIYIHGIATMLATGYVDFDQETISRFVSEAHNRFSK